MQSADLELRPIADTPRADIVDLLRTCLGDGPRRSEDFWRWKHEDNPFGRSPGVAAYVGGSLAGIRVFLRWQLVSGVTTLRAVRAVDTATHPSWRRLGLFRKMTLAVLDEVEREGIDLVFNTPNAQSQAGYLTMGWEALGRTSMLVRPAAPWRWPPHVEAEGKAYGRGPAADEAGITALLSEPRFGPMLARLGENESRLRTPRDIPYLRWRYIAAPGLDYTARWRIDASGHGAAIIARPSVRGGLRVLILSEVLVASDRSAIAAAVSLLGELSDLDRHHYAVAHAMTGTPERRALLRAGFVAIPRLGPRMTARRMNPELRTPDPTVRASWRLSLGDLEVF